MNDDEGFPTKRKTSQKIEQWKKNHKTLLFFNEQNLLRLVHDFLSQAIGGASDANSGSFKQKHDYHKGVDSIDGVASFDILLHIKTDGEQGNGDHVGDGAQHSNDEV